MVFSNEANGGTRLQAKPHVAVKVLRIEECAGLRGR
jgi:hypothetical protein